MALNALDGGVLSSLVN